MTKLTFQHKLLAVCLGAALSQSAIASETLSIQKSKSGDSSIQVIGGTDTNARDWMVSIRMAPYGHICGGSLIGSQWVLTAAHCVEGGTRPSQLELQVGARDIGNDNDGTLVDVSEIHIHPSWNTNTIDNDIALIRLASPVNHDTVGITTGAAGDTATLIGWGDTSHGRGNYPDILQEVDLPVISPAECDATWSRYGANISSSQICASTAQKSSCSGDSGGPLYVNENGMDKQIGVVSFGYTARCVSRKAPSVYTRVSSYTGWINSITNLQLSDSNLF